MSAAPDPASPTVKVLNRGAVIDDRCHVTIGEGGITDDVVFQGVAGRVDNQYIFNSGTPAPSAPRDPQLKLVHGREDVVARMCSFNRVVQASGYEEAEVVGESERAPR